jgi:hypothetical protein
MALSNRRWALAAALGCAAIAVAYLPPAVIDRRRLFVLEPADAGAVRNNLRTVAEALRATNERLAQMEIVDSLMGLPAVSRAAADRPTVVVDTRAVAPAVRQAIERLIADQWPSVAPAHGDVRFVLAVFLDTGTMRHGMHRRAPFAPSVRWALPSATDGHTCLTMLMVRSRDNSQAGFLSGARWPNLYAQLFGPCAYYAAFGAPGPAIQAWLTGGALLPATEADFRSHSAPVHLPMFATGAPPWRVALMALVAEPWGLPLPMLFPCVARDPNACERAMLGQSARERPAGSLDTIAIFRAPLYFQSTHELPTRMLSDLVHDEGRERFARFWASPAPVDSAFRAAYGRRLGAWAGDWARAAYGEVITPSRLTADDVLSVAVAVALGLLAVFGLAARRRVG